jgi:hypothetical protein
MGMVGFLANGSIEHRPPDLSAVLSGDAFAKMLSVRGDLSPIAR